MEKKNQGPSDLFLFSKPKPLKALFTELKIVVGLVTSYWKEKLKLAELWMEKYVLTEKQKAKFYFRSLHFS